MTVVSPEAQSQESETLVFGAFLGGVNEQNYPLQVDSSVRNKSWT
jgi:hypothetical protein